MAYSHAGQPNLASHLDARQVLTAAGFLAKLREGSGSATANSAVRAKVSERQARLREATGRLALAWLLASACLTGHLAHLWPSAPRLLHLLGSAPVHAAMSALAMLGALFSFATMPSTCFLSVTQ